MTLAYPIALSRVTRRINPHPARQTALQAHAVEVARARAARVVPSKRRPTKLDLNLSASKTATNAQRVTPSRSTLAKETTRKIGERAKSALSCECVVMDMKRKSTKVHYYYWNAELTRGTTKMGNMVTKIEILMGRIGSAFYSIWLLGSCFSDETNILLWSTPEPRS
jgi:hypothetical protein